MGKLAQMSNSKMDYKNELQLVLKNTQNHPNNHLYLLFHLYRIMGYQCQQNPLDLVLIIQHNLLSSEVHNRAQSQYMKV